MGLRGIVWVNQEGTSLQTSPSFVRRGEGESWKRAMRFHSGVGTRYPTSLGPLRTQAPYKGEESNRRKLGTDS